MGTGAGTSVGIVVRVGANVAVGAVVLVGAAVTVGGTAVGAGAAGVQAASRATAIKIWVMEWTWRMANPPGGTGTWGLRQKMSASQY